MSESTKNVVVIGGGHAAAEAIATLVKQQWQGRICLINDEPLLPYHRPPLSKAYFKDGGEHEKLLLKPAKFYDEARVDLYLGKSAVNIDRENHTVELDDGQSLPYSKLIIASGARPRKLELEGATATDIHYLRNVTDVDGIRSNLKADDKLLIIGAGYIGLEVAASAVTSGLNVTVLEAQQRVLARVTSEPISAFYQDLHAQYGVDIKLNAMCEKVVHSNGKRFMQLNSGEQVEFDLILAGIGVLPNVELAEQAELDCDNGICVDEFGRTSDPDIYAIGDCCIQKNPFYQRQVRIESVPSALSQAKIASLHICGGDEASAQLPWFWSDQYGVKLQAAGLMSDFDEVQVEGDTKEQKFTVSYFRDGQLIALDAINSPKEFMGAKRQLMEQFG